MAYYDENGTITIDENAAQLDMRRISNAVGLLEQSKKTLNHLIGQSSAGQGETMAAVAEKADELVSKINDLMGRLQDTSDFIARTVTHYQQVDQQLKDAVNASGNGGN